MRRFQLRRSPDSRTGKPEISKKIKQFAGESRGETRINVEGAGYVYLKYSKSTEVDAVWYSRHKFEHPEDGTLLKKSTFDEAFRLEKKKQKMSKSKKSQR